MLDVKEGDHLALPMGGFSPPKKLTVTRVLANRVETNDGNAWNIKHGGQWGVQSGDAVHPWGPTDTMLVEMFAAQGLARAIDKHLRDYAVPSKTKAAALPYLREAALALGLEVK